jgi:XTP/dITP diphosphohydrolase
MKFVLASNNPGKLKEMREILSEIGIEVISQKEAGICVEPEEDGVTFQANSIIKARASCEASGLPAIADDSGLVVEALGGQPGVYSARYGGDGLSDADRYTLLLKNMEGKTDRRAKFVSCISCVFPNGDIITAEGECHGEILHAPAGDGGFGYDPVFFVKGLEKSMGEMTHEEKNSISHRGNAIRAFYPKLRDYLKKQ